MPDQTDWLVDRIYEDPLADSENRPFWEATKEGRFLIKRCLDCTQPHWYPRSLCPYCQSERTEWIQARGTGTIYSVTINRRSERRPYALALVTLDEGVTVLTNIVDCNSGQLRIGDRVRVAFKATASGDAIPVFTPAR